MAAQDRTTLKGYFNTGDVPTEAQFANLIDSFPLVAEMAADMAAKAPLADPAFTGTPTVPTATVSDDSTQAANTAFVQGELAALAVPEPTVSGFWYTDASGTPITDVKSAAETKALLFGGLTGIMSVSGGVVAASANPEVTTLDVGHASDTTVSRSAAGLIAVEGVVLAPHLRQNSQSTAYTLVIGDANSHIYHPSADTTARTWTIPANASVAFPVGTFITFVNDTSAGVLTIAITSDTLVLAGAGTTGSRTLAANGMATAIKVTSTRWMISGTGLT